MFLVSFSITILVLRAAAAGGGGGERERVRPRRLGERECERIEVLESRRAGEREGEREVVPLAGRVGERVVSGALFLSTGSVERAREALRAGGEDMVGDVVVSFKQSCRHRGWEWW